MKKLLLLSALLIFACSTESEGNPCIYEPTLTTQAATDITETSATLNGVTSIISENCDVPNNTEQGFVYSTEIQPTLEDTQVNVNGTNITTTIEGLEPNTTYYVRSFLTNTLGEFYSNEVSFSTEENDFIFAGKWLGIPFGSLAFIVKSGTGEYSNQGNMYRIPIDFNNQFDWSISDATAEYDWFIETINGQRILTVSGGFYGQDEIIIENEGDYCNEEWYFLPITDSWFERVDCD